MWIRIFIPILTILFFVGCGAPLIEAPEDDPEKIETTQAIMDFSDYEDYDRAILYFSCSRKETRRITYELPPKDYKLDVSNIEHNCDEVTPLGDYINMPVKEGNLDTVEALVGLTFELTSTTNPSLEAIHLFPIPGRQGGLPFYALNSGYAKFDDPVQREPLRRVTGEINILPGWQGLTFIDDFPYLVAELVPFDELNWVRTNPPTY